MTQICKLAPWGAMGFLLLIVFFPSNLSAQSSNNGNVADIELKTFYSKALSENRTIRIYVPSNHDHYNTYPVLYVLDGEVFTPMICGQVHYLSDAYKIIPNLIVVGIENTDRVRDLTPTHSSIGPDGKPDTSAQAFGRTSGGGETFLKFLNGELMPYIEQHYPTAPYRILAGHSLGGLLAMHCLITHPDYFNAYIAISPSLQWDNKVLLNETVKVLPLQRVSNKILFFSDANEDEAFHHNQLIVDSMLGRTPGLGIRYKRMFYPEENHLTEPVKAFYDALRFIYPDWHLPYGSSAFRKKMNSQIIKEHVVALSNKYGYNVKLLHDEVNRISRFLSRDSSHVKDAIELLQMNGANYPASPIVQELLGDTWLKTGNIKNALSAYRQALLLEPENEKLR